MENKFTKFIRRVLITLFVVFTFNTTWAQIAAWDFYGYGSTSLPTFAATTFDANLISASGASDITRGSTAAWSTGSNSFRTVGFQNNGISTANTDYFQITLTANTGYKVSLSTIDARFAGTATFCASPGVSNQFAYSLDGTNFTLIGSPSAIIGSPNTLPQIDLSGISALQDVAAGTTITLRFYASGQTTTGGWGFNSPAAGQNGLAIGGTVVSASTATVDWCNLQWPASGTVCQNETYNVYAQIYQSGVTEAVGQGANIEAWIGYSANNDDPSTWTNWIAATYNTDNGNNDEYVADLGALPAGTYYYASRFRYDNGTYAYGGYNVGGGGFWEGINNINGVLTIYALPTPSITGILSYCEGGNTALDAGSYTSYLWTGGATTQTITATAGAYTVTVTDGNGCEGTASVTVTENANPTPSITGTLSYCEGGGTTLDAGVYTTYNWSSGETTQTITATSGVYNVQVIDGNGCTGTSADVTVVENSNPTPSITGILSYCEGGNTALDAGSYTSYLWTGGATTQTITATAGAYTVTVTDGNGCEGTASVTVTENANPTPSITGTLSYCEGGSTTLDAGVYTTYNWSSGETTQTITATAGIYNVEVTDGNGCIGTSADVTVVENSNPTPSITGTLSYCEGGNTTLDAGSYTSYLWAGGATTQTISATVGTYNVQVTDANGCTGTSPDVTVMVNANPTPAITGTLTYCEGSSTTLDAGAYTSYLWTGGATTQTISATVGTYNVQVTDANGCTGTSPDVTVMVNANPTPVITGTLTYCEGGNTTLDAGVYTTYNWSSGETTQTITATAGTYNVEVTDGNGCIGTSANVNVIENPNPNPVISGSLSYCTGFNTTLNTGAYASYLWSTTETTQSVDVTTADNSISVTVTDANGCIGVSASVDVVETVSLSPSITGTLSYCEGSSTTLDAGSYTSYLWSDVSSSTTQTITATAGTYSVTVTDENGCQGTASATVTENSNPTPSITGTLSYCEGGNTTLDAGAYTSYLWTGGATTQTITATSGVYNVQVTDGNGCTGTSADVTVVENSNPTPSITGTLSYCEGGNTTLDAGAYTSYLWTGGATTQTITATSGVYNVQVTDGNGCTGTSADVTVVENSNPTPSITGTLSYCEGGNTTLDAGAYTSYLWTGGATTQTITATSGVYNVQVTDGNGCTGTSADVTVVENSNPTPSITGTLSYCEGGNTTLDAGAYTSYLWSDVASSTTQAITAVAGAYTVTVTDGNGCQGTASVTVTENTNPSPSISGTLTYIQGSSTLLDAGSYTTYNWSTGAATQTINATIADNPIDVTVTDANGCTGISAQVNVIEISTETDILSYSFAEQTGPATIDAMNHTVSIEVANGTDVTNLIATYTLSTGATADILGLPQTSGVTSNNFTNTVIYTINAEDGATNQDWDVIVTIAAPVCNDPSILSASNIAATSADVNWTENGTATSWSIEYGPVGFTQGTGTIVPVAAKPYSLTSLTPNTSYDYYVQSNCGGSIVSNWVGPYTFTTPCQVATFPYSENFDNGGLIPDCWVNETTNDWDWDFLASTTSLGGAITGDHTSGTGYFAYFNSWDAGNGDIGVITSQTIDLSSSNNPELHFFWNRPKTGYTARLEVNVFANGTWNNDLVAGLSSQTTGWTEVVLNMASYKFNDVKLQFKVVGDWYRNIGLDDVSIVEAPTCPAPNTIAVANITSNTADISWVNGGSETAWNIQYGPSGFSLGTGTIVPVTTNPYTLTGLTASTNYSIYVQADCGGGDQSTWVGPYTFATVCDLASIPWTEGFEGVTAGTLPLCMAKTGDFTTASTNQTYHRVPHTGTNYLFTSWSADDWTFTPGFDLTAGTAYDFSTWFITDGVSGWTTVELKAGTSQTAVDMTNAIVSVSNPIDTVYNELKGVFTPSVSGTYYFGLHVVGTSNPWYITFDDFNVDLAPTDAVDWCNLQWPGTANVEEGNNISVYAQAWEPGVTDMAGQAAGLNAWIGYSTTDSDPSTWTNWISAVYNIESGNNDEFMASFGAALPIGTYYYASRFQLNGGPYTYGGFSGGFWDGINNISGILTITPPSCVIPTGFTSSNITSTTVDFNWTENGTATAWEIEYGAPGYTLGTGTVVTATSTPITITGLTSDMDYDFYLRSDCGGGDYSGWAGPVSILTRVANDECVNAITINCSDVVVGSTNNATVDDVVAPNCGTVEVSAPGVWYKFIGTGELITMSTCSNANYDTKLSIYTGDCSGLSCVAANDDQTGCTGYTSEASFTSVLGTEYYVLVHGYSSVDYGDFNLTVTCEPACSPVPANDNCTTAENVDLALPGACTPITGTNQCASVSFDNPSCDPYGTIQDVWYKFNSGNVNSVAMNLTLGTATDLNYSVYNGCGGTQLICNSTNAVGDNVINGLTPSTDYYLRIWNAGDAAEGDFTICLEENNTLAEVLAYSLPNQTGPAVIDSLNRTITIELGYGTDPSSLIADFTLSYAANAAISGTSQQSGVTVNDFTNPVVYDVTAQNGTIVSWTVTVTVAATLNNETDFLTYSFAEQTGSATIDNINHTINVEVNWLADVANLTADYTLSYGATAAITGTPQVSGSTVNNFTTPVTYDVTAEDGTTAQAWVVTVTKEVHVPQIVITEIMYNPPESGTDSLEYVEIYNNDVVSFDLAGYSFTGVTYTFPSYVMDPGDYAVIAINPNAINNNFAYSGALTFTGALSNNGEYIVLKNGTTVIDSVNFDDVTPWNMLADGYGRSLVLCDPNSDNTVASNWSVSTTGTSLNINTFDVFASPGAADACLTLNTGNDIIAYSFAEQTGPAVIDDVNHTVAIEVAYGTDVTALVADFTLSQGALALIGTTVHQISGVTVNNYTGVVTYTIISENGVTATWTVTVTIAPAPVTDIAIITPPSGNYTSCNLTATEVAEIRVQNVGNTTLVTGTEIPVSYQIDANPVVLDTIHLTADMLPGDTITFDFAQTVDMSALAVYNWVFATSFVDNDASNNSTNGTVEHIELTVSIANGDTIQSLVTDLPVTLSTVDTYDYYQWQDGLGTIISNTATAEANDFGWYYVTVWNNNSDCDPVSDSILIEEILPPSVDLAITNPTSGNWTTCGLTNTEIIEITVTNVGATAILSGETISLTAEVDNNSPVTEQYILASDLNPGESFNYTFGQTFDLSALGVYNWSMNLSYTGDLNSTNDVVSGTLTHTTISVDIASGDTLHAYAFELPLTLTTTDVYDEYIWSDGSFTTYSPTYQANAFGWYYVTVSYANSNCEAIDSVYVEEIPQLNYDLAITMPNVSYVEVCGFDGTDTVMVEITNIGLNTISAGETIYGYCQIDGGTLVKDSIVLTSDFNSLESMMLVFNHTYDFSAITTYNFLVYIEYAGDMNNNNDTVSGILSHVEYNLDLDALNGGVNDTLTVSSYPVTLDAGSFQYYLWDDNSTNSTLVVNADGWHSVNVYNDYDCHAYDSIYVKLFVGNEIVDAKTTINVYPNPNKGEFNLEIKLGKSESVTIDLMTYTGQVINTEQVLNVKSFNKSFDVTNLPKGLYFIRINDGFTTTVEKVIVQ